MTLRANIVSAAVTAAGADAWNRGVGAAAQTGLSIYISVGGTWFVDKTGRSLLPQTYVSHAPLSGYANLAAFQSALTANTVDPQPQCGPF